MGLRFNTNVSSSAYFAQNGIAKKVTNNKTEENNKQAEHKRDNVVKLPYIADRYSSEILSNYGKALINFQDYQNRKNVPAGHSKYEFRGGRFDIFRKGENYKSQFVHPQNFDVEEFKKRFPVLTPIITVDDNNDTSDSKSTINGLIDENTIQGLTGDCWLISGVYSLAATTIGREIIKNSITINDDGTVTVNFKGLNISYILTEEEISKFDTDNILEDEYSNGDNDILAFELATEKLWNDINSGVVVLPTNNENLIYTGIGNGIDDGGLPSQIIYYLTGIESEELYNEDVSALEAEIVYSALEKALGNDNVVLSIGIYDGVHSATLIDGTIYSIDLGESGHSLAITSVTKDTVTFVNPWDTSVEYTLSWSEFAKLGIGYISITELNNVENSDDDTNIDDTKDTDISDENEVNNNDEIIFDYYFMPKFDFNSNIEFFLYYIDSMFKVMDDMMKYFFGFDMNPEFEQE
ncbi:hypothetical protein IJ182_04660 [bacterium]|nr:hypothetical protein [bacterium]